MSNPSKNTKAREQFNEIVEERGFWNINDTHLAKELGTARANVNRWRNQYIKKNGVPDIKVLGQEFNLNAISAMKELISLTRSDSKHLRLKAIQIYFDSLGKYTSFLEQFGYKEKVAELHAVVEYATIEIVPPAWVPKVQDEKQEKVIDIVK